MKAGFQVFVTCIRGKIIVFYTGGQNFNLFLKQSIVYTTVITFDQWLKLLVKIKIRHKSQKIIYTFLARGQIKLVQNWIMARRVSNTKT